MNELLRLLISGVIIVASTSVHGNVCPGTNVPSTVNAIHVKYKITDELEIKRQKSNGSPSNVRGDELAELIVWNEYRWERLFGKYWYIDDDAYLKQMDAYEKKMDFYLQQQMNGMDVTARVEKLSNKLLTYQPKFKAYEYDRISVHTPKYSLDYNISDKVGYGYFGPNLVANRNKLNSNISSQVDAFITASFRNSNKILGIKKISNSNSSILGIPCKREIVSTSFQDFERNYGEIESCVARIAGHDIDLYTKMGNPGERYIMKAIEVKQSSAIKKSIFCNPSYVTVN